LFADDAAITAIPIDWTTHVPRTCYVRLMTFHPDGAAIFGERILQLDLDTMIVGNLDAIASREEDLILWRNSCWGPAFPSRAFYNTSVLSHRCGTEPYIWRQCARMTEAACRALKDDQWYLSAVVGKEAPYFDGARDGVYRIAREDTPGSGVWGALPKNARIVTFPGSEGKADNPRVRAGNPWIREFAA
jgi:hypothetical protein